MVIASEAEDWCGAVCWLPHTVSCSIWGGEPCKSAFSQLRTYSWLTFETLDLVLFCEFGLCAAACTIWLRRLLDFHLGVLLFGFILVRCCNCGFPVAAHAIGLFSCRLNHYLGTERTSSRRGSTRGLNR